MKKDNLPIFLEGLLYLLERGVLLQSERVHSSYGDLVSVEAHCVTIGVRFIKAPTFTTKGQNRAFTLPRAAGGSSVDQGSKLDHIADEEAAHCYDHWDDKNGMHLIRNEAVSQTIHLQLRLFTIMRLQDFDCKLTITGPGSRSDN